MHHVCAAPGRSRCASGESRCCWHKRLSVLSNTREEAAGHALAEYCLHRACRRRARKCPSATRGSTSALPLLTVKGLHTLIWFSVEGWHALTSCTPVC